MSKAFHNEVIIGLIGGIGVDFDRIYEKIKEQLEKTGYCINYITVSDFFTEKKDATKGPFYEMYRKMQLGSFERKNKEDKSIWAKKIIKRIFTNRKKSDNKKTAHIIRSLKTIEEIECLSNVYGRNFLSIAIFSDEVKRKRNLYDNLSTLTETQIISNREELLELNKKIFNQENNTDHGLEALYSKIDEIKIKPGLFNFLPKNKQKKEMIKKICDFLIEKDKHETDEYIGYFGQNLENCFSSANYFLVDDHSIDSEIQRFVRILFGDPFCSPTIEEYYMFQAQSAAYRSMDLDRQVGAVIVNKENELISIGFNDVCKVGGGHYSDRDSKDIKDERDYKKDMEYNHKKLDDLTCELCAKVTSELNEEQSNNQLKELVREELRCITEFKRSTHAEMSSLLDAARRGISIKNCTIYINTYPCHNCAKHIIASGIMKIVYLHPYPKSEAKEMFGNMIDENISSKEDKENKVIFKPFFGLAPNRFIFAFPNDSSTRQEKDNNKPNGHPRKWSLDPSKLPKYLEERQSHTYITREYQVMFNDTNKLNEIVDSFYQGNDK